MANKQDIRGAIDELDVVDNLNVEELANSMRCPTRVEVCSCMYSDEKSKEKTTGITEAYRQIYFFNCALLMPVM